MDVLLIESLEEASAFTEPWDALAVRSARPFCSPAWTLSWWRHVAPPRSRLKLFVAKDAGDVIGVAPFFAHRSPIGLVRYRMLGSRPGAFRVEPLAAPEREWEVASGIAGSLSEAEPSPDSIIFDGIPV